MAEELWCIYYFLTREFDESTNPELWPEYQRKESQKYQKLVYEAINEIAFDLKLGYYEFSSARYSIESKSEKYRCYKAKNSTLLDTVKRTITKLDRNSGIYA